MSRNPQKISNGTGPASVDVAAVHDILVAYDKTNDGVIVTPGEVRKGSTVRFKDPAGGKLRIKFLLPNGKESDPVMDSETYTLTVGGTYHFKCFFTLPGTTREISPRYGGVIDVMPQRP